MRTFVAALALVVLSLALRLPHGELAEWKGDEAIQYAHARAIAREHVLPERGLPTTDGPRLPVHFLYVLSVPLFFADSPEAIRVGMAVFSTLAILAVFLLGRRDLGARAALACALLLATLPDEVRRGRWSWNPNLIPPLAALALLVLVRLAKAPRGRAGALALAFGTLLPLIHYSLVGLGGLSFVSGWWFTKNRTARWVGVTLAVLLLLPHLAIEARSGFKATRGALAVAEKGHDQDERAPLTFPKLVFSELALESYSQAAGIEPLAFEPYVSLVFQAVVLFGIALGARELARALRERRAPGPEGVALAMALAAWAPFLLLGLPARQHYVQTAFPPLVFLGAHALTRIPRGGLLLPIVAWGGVLSVWAVLASAERGLVATGTGYDLPYREKKAPCVELLEKELELVSYPRLEYRFALEAAYRELPEAKKARFVTTTEKVPYWDAPLLVVRPKEPRGRAAILLAETRALVVEVR